MALPLNLKNATFKTQLDALITAAAPSGDALLFANGLKSYLYNRRGLVTEMSYFIDHPQAVLVDEYGVASLLIDGL